MRLSTTTAAGGATAGIGCLFLTFQLLFAAGIVMLLGLWTDRNLDFWVSHYKGAPVDVPYWLSCICSLGGPITIVGNAIAEVARLAL